MLLLLLLLLLLLQGAVLPAATLAAQIGVACGCDAQALYSVVHNDILFDISNRFQLSDYGPIAALSNLTHPDSILPGLLLHIPFHCDCQSDAIPAHIFAYTVQPSDEDDTIPAKYYSNLTTADAIDNANQGGQFITPGQVLNIPINCSCGSSSVSDLYGLFGTYAVQLNDTLSSLSRRFNIEQELLRQYNPTINFDPLLPFVSILFIPLTNSSGQYPPFEASGSPAGGVGGSNQGIIIGVTVGAGIFLFIVGLGFWFLRARCVTQSQKVKGRAHDEFTEAFDPASATRTMFNNNAVSEKSSNKHGALQANHCINFSYDELAAATDNFSLSKQIGKGGFATVFYGEWRGQKLAVKRMEMKAQKEFSNELMILSSVHHANLVDLIGFCTEGYLFLVYEYMDNGTLDHHLHSGANPMRWTTRVEIALDAARGIEYIHEHTIPTYIHRDLKPNNILLDSNFHAKVGDFGLTRLLDRDGDGWTKTFSTCGTFGYMAPEYAQFGQISVKLDVFAFGIILFQLVSGRKAIGETSEQLQYLFEAVLEASDGQEEFRHLVDPALGTDYPIQSAWKMVKLAGRCTQKQPELRPQMREVVMQLMTLSEATQTN